jgi:hypothetical protein
MTTSNPTSTTTNRLLALAAVLSLAGGLGLGIAGGCGDESSPGAPGAGGAGSGGRGGSGPGSGGAPGAGGQAAGSGGATGSGGSAAGTGGGGAPTGGTSGGTGGGGGGNVDAAPSGSGGAPGADPKTTVVIFLIDGLQPDAARTAAANGASNLKMIIEGGVTVTTALSTTPAARTTLANGSLPWGNATSGNIAVHTGTHLYEAGPAGLQDIFQAARAAGIKSVFSGGDANYMGLNTADFKYAANVSDQVVVEQAITHLKNDKVRLLRLHLQRIRDDWAGPASKTNPASPYLRHIVASDALLGMLIQALKDGGVWDSTYLVVTADHGMGTAASSSHPPSVRASWDIFMAFHGPGLKKGATIPYAELPDVAVTAAHFLGLPPLKGHTGETPGLTVKGPTGTVLKNLYLGAPDELPHPRYVDQYLKLGTFSSGGENYPPYRMGMLGLIK